MANFFDGAKRGLGFFSIAPGVSEDDAPKDTGMSGDEARARAAGDTRSKMRPQDIDYAYDTAAARGDRGEAKAMARAFVDRERADSPKWMAVSDRTRAFARGVPIVGGLLDEGNAAASVLFGGDYDKALDYERARDTSFDEAHPKEAIGWQLGGGLASGMGAAAKVAPWLFGMSRPGAIAAGAGTGAAVGGVDGFTRGEEGLENRAGSALLGAGIGGAVGGLMPIIGKGVQTLVDKGADRFIKDRGLKGMGLSRSSGEILTRAAESDGTLGGQGARNIAAAGPDGMLVDAGPNAVQLLDTGIQRGGKGAVAAREAVAGRVDRASANVRDALDNALGPPQGVQSTTTAIRQGTAAGRRSAYDAAYGAAIDYANPAARGLEDLLTRVPQGAIARANTLMKLEGAKSAQIMAQIAPDGTVTFKTMPDVRQIDYITRALNDVAKAGDGQGALGGFTAEGRAYGNLSRDIRTTLRGLVPEYGAALDTAAEPIAARTALELGSSILRPSTARDAVAEELRGMSRAEREMVRRGVRAQIDEVLANVRRTMSDPNVDARQGAQAVKDLSSDAARDKMRLVLGTQEADRLFQRIDEAATAFNLQAGIAQNSKTATRGMAKEVVERASEPGPLGTLMEGSPVKAGKKMLQQALGTGPAARQAAEDQIWDEVLQALTGPRANAAQRLIMELNDINTRSGTAARAARSAGTLGAGAAGGLGYAGGSLLFNR